MRWWTFEDEPLPKCPRLLVPDWFWPLIPLYHAYSKGILWCGGGMSEQPRQYLIAMQEITRKIGELEAERAEAARKQR